MKLQKNKTDIWILVLKVFNTRTPFLLLLLNFNCQISNFDSAKIIDRSVGISQSYNDSLPFASGLIVSNKEILTVFHAVTGHEKDLVYFENSNSKYRLNLIKSEFLFDLALLRCEECNFEFNSFTYKDRSELKVGEKIYLFGTPYRLNHSYKEGYISHLDRTGIDPTYPKIPFIQTYGMSDPGNSGAGVFSMEGKFIGIQRANFGYQAGSEIGLVIPSAFVNRFLK